jgi:hypothetical protein
MLAPAYRALLLLCATSSCYSGPGLADGDLPQRAHGVASPRTARPAAGGDVCAPGTFVLGPDLTNARDLGGTPLGPSKIVACGDVFRGPPLSVSAAGCAEVAKLGLRTVIDLRTESERQYAPDADCVDAARVLAPMPVPYSVSANDYLNDLHETTAIAAAFHAFGDASAYPIYFHCTFGRDRTGIVGALLLLALGASRQTVLNEYLLSEPFVGAYPDSLGAVLDEVEQRGGVEAVLHEAGIGDADLAALGEHAIANQ